MKNDFIQTYNSLKVKMLYPAILFFAIKNIIAIFLCFYYNLEILTLIIHSFNLFVNVGIIILVYRNNNRLKTANLILVYLTAISIFLALSLNVTGVPVSFLLGRDLTILNILILITAFMVGRFHTVLFSAFLIISFVSMLLIFNVDIYSEYLYYIIFFIMAAGFVYSIMANLIETTIKMSIESKLKIEELSTFKNKITQFIYHDLKVPVNSIIELNLNFNASNSIKTTQYAKTIKRHLEDVLDVEMLATAELSLAKENVSVSSLIKNAISSVQVLAVQKNITVSCETESVGYLLCDSSVMERVLVNLLYNAIKFSNNNTEVVIHVYSINNSCVIKIKDQGVGIKNEYIDKVFDKYFKVESASQDIYSSSNGLGLTFCKLAINSHGGTIKVKSIENEGSEFIAEIPGYTIEENCAEKIVKNKTSICLSDSDKIYLNEFARELIKVQIYNMGQIIVQVEKIETSKSEQISHWKDLVLNAVYSGNQENYTTLMQNIIDDREGIN